VTFVAGLEKLTGRILHPRKRGPKPGISKLFSNGTVDCQ